MPTPQERYLELLLERVSKDRYPSHQLLDRIEASFWSPDQLVAYINMLIDKCDETWYPSHELLERIQRLLAVSAQA